MYTLAAFEYIITDTSAETVIAATADEMILPCTTDQCVITATGRKGIVKHIPRKSIISASGGDMLDITNAVLISSRNRYRNVLRTVECH